jgi:hypothetical protein
MSEWNRREVLEAATALAAFTSLGSGAAALAGCGGVPLPGAAPSPEPLARALVGGRLWSRFCSTIEAAGEHVRSPRAPASELDRAEGYRMLTRLIGLGLEMFVEGADADRPAFLELQSAIRKYAGDNPDQRYAAAVIAGDRRYRITGQRGNAVLVELGVYAGNFSGGGARRLVASRSEAELAFARDGSAEVLLAPDADPSQPNQIRLEPDASSVLIRQYFRDPLDKRASWKIERVPAAEPAPPLAASAFAQRLLGAALFVEQNAKTWADFMAERRAWPANRLTPLPDAGDLQTPSGVRYLEGYFELAEDEALVLDFAPEPVPYWGLVLTNFWMESFDWRDRRTSINNFQALPEADGKSIRIAVAARDPGHPNWLDTSGHREGGLSLRWARHPRLPEVRSRVVPVAALSKGSA